MAHIEFFLVAGSIPAGPTFCPTLPDERRCLKEDQYAFAVGPHNRARLRQGEVRGVHRPPVRADVRGALGHFAPVKVNDILTLDFDDSDNPRSNHYAFLASDGEFDAILQRIKDEGVVFGSGPRSRTDGDLNHLHQGRGFYFECENGHVWEVITHTYVTEQRALIFLTGMGRWRLPHAGLADRTMDE